MRPSPALIFDLDGTLVDTAPDLLGATNAVLAARGRSSVGLDALRHMVGFGASALIEQAMAATGDPMDPTDMPALTGIFIDHYRAHIADHSVIFPGVEATLDHLRAQGARLAVLTNKPQELTDLLMPALGLDQYFSEIYGAGRMTYIKPDARIFHDVVRDISTDGRDGPAVMIGDSVTDLNTGRAAGAPVILFSYGYTPVPASELGADRVLDDFARLPEALAEMGIL